MFLLAHLPIALALNRSLTFMHTHTQTLKHTHLHTNMYMHILVVTSIHIYIHIYTCIFISTIISVYLHTYICTLAFAQVEAEFDAKEAAALAAGTSDRDTDRLIDEESVNRR